MSTITESTALRLAEALERVAVALEGGQGDQRLYPPPRPSGSERVARLIVGGLEAAKAENARHRRINSKRQSR